MKEKRAKNILPCSIKWMSDLSQIEGDRFDSLPKNQLLQSSPYLRAVSKINNYSIRYGVIDMNGEFAGVCSVLETGLFKNVVHAVMLDQGPIWNEGYGSEADFAAFLHAFRSEFPKRFGRRVRFIPNVKNTAGVRDALREYGFKLQGEAYKTIWLNCSQDESALRTHLKKKWRNSLAKAEKSNLDIVWSAGGPDLGWLVENYIEDKSEKKYVGPSLKTLMALISEFSRGQNLMIGTAMLDGKPIAAILILIHGKSATYQIGYSGKVGREKCAHHLLLWDALRKLKERQVNDFDLGGINEEGAKGVRDFKIGMGGEVFESPGLWA